MIDFYNFPYSWKCKECGQVYYTGSIPTNLKNGLGYCFNCKRECFSVRRKKVDFLRKIFNPFFSFCSFVYGVIQRLKKFWPIFVIVFASIFGTICIVYSAYCFNKNECRRINRLGYETDFDFYGGCFIKKDGEWISFKEYKNIKIIEENR